MDNKYKTAAVIGGAVGIGLAGQWIYKEYFTKGSNDSLVTRAAGAAINTVAPRLDYCTVPNVMVGFPLVGTDGTLRDGPVTNSNMNGILKIAREIFGDYNSAKVACAFASCECMNGDLVVNCGSCSLFNIHHGSCGNEIDIATPGGEIVFLPATYIGTDRIIAFNNGAVTQVQGFTRCMAHFKDYLARRCPNALEYMRQGNFEGFQIEISRIGYARSYTNAVQGNSVTNPFVRARYERLVRAGLISADTGGSSGSW